MRTFLRRLLSLAPALAVLALHLAVVPSSKAASFTSTGSLNTARYGHSAALLSNGKVLVAGGHDGTTTLASAELYDPATFKWLPTGSLTSPRAYHTATVLLDGRVLIVGLPSSAELYDPATSRWTLAGGMNTMSSGHTATLLPNGKVLVAAGHDQRSQPLARAELYDPATGKWTLTGSLHAARDIHSATLLPNGKVLVLGGLNRNLNFSSLASAEIYDPAIGVWFAAGAMTTARDSHAAILLPDGKVLVAGGWIHTNFGGTGTLTAELFDSASGTSTPTSAMSSNSVPVIAALLPNGKVLVAGWGAELYDSATKQWMGAGPMVVARAFDAPTETLLSNGRVLLAGGRAISNGVGIVLASAERYNDSLALQPRILTQPQSQIAPAGANVTFGVTAVSALPLTYQWSKAGVNIAGATSSTLTLYAMGASASDGYSVVVRNTIGSVVSATASLAVLTDGANGNQPTPVTALFCPPAPANKDSLVLITHGVAPGDHLAGRERFGDISWITNMANAIRATVNANWEVRTLDWTTNSQLTGPDSVAYLGGIAGSLYGQQLARQQPWANVHLIAHSAGAAVIEAIAAELKSLPSPPQIHETFLDPFLGYAERDLSGYGKNADWADNYFSRDDGTGWTTDGALLQAYNVDVSWLDPKRSRVVATDPSASSASPSCVAFASPGWPHDFYLNSIAGSLPACAESLGFALSKEAGGWNNHANYRRGESAPAPCQDCPPPALTTTGLPLSLNGQINLNLSAYTTSPTGAGSIAASAFQLKTTGTPPAPLSGGPASGTSAPAWLAVSVAVTDSVNFVQFDAAFTGTNGAQGLLTVYWNTNQIGLVDQRAASPGWEKYRFTLPDKLTSGWYTLSFRLDSFNGTAASVIVTNVQSGFAGLDETFRLDLLRMGSNQAPVLKLTGPPSYAYLVQSSTNLLDWKPTALLVNASGTVLYSDPEITNSNRRFYRAMAYAPVNLGNPTLNIARQSNSLILSWPTNFTGFTLERATNLSPTNWRSLAVSPTVVNGQYTVTYPLFGGAGFFRLKR